MEYFKMHINKKHGRPYRNEIIFIILPQGNLSSSDWLMAIG